MKFYVGQKVMIRKDLQQGQDYMFGVNQEMEDLAGEVCTIKYVSDIGDHINVRLEGSDCSWTPSTFVLLPKDEEELFALLLEGKITDVEYDEMKETHSRID